MTPPAAEITQLIDKEVADSARKVRYYGYLARHLRQINDTLQCIGVLASSIAIFCVLGGLYRFALDCLILATLSFAIPTLRNDSNRSLRSGEISHQLAQLHLEWQDLWNAARTDSNIDVLPDWKKLSKPSTLDPRTCSPRPHAVSLARPQSAERPSRLLDPRHRRHEPLQDRRRQPGRITLTP